MKNGATEDGTIVTGEDIDKAGFDLQKKLTEVVNTQVTEKDGLKSLFMQSQFEVDRLSKNNENDNLLP